MSWMSTYVDVEISPETTIKPVFTSVSHATRPYGSSCITASSTPSEIWSAILSGWPSVTDSEVNRNSLSPGWLISRASLGHAHAPLAGGALPALHEVDHQRHPLQSVAGAH